MNDQIDGVSRSGDFVVIERGMARYPPICIWCGEAPSEELTPVTLIHMRGRRSYEQIKEGLPVCKNCHANSKGRAKAAMSVGAALFAVGVIMMIILSNGGFTPDSPVAIGLGIGSGGVALVALSGATCLPASAGQRGRLLTEGASRAREVALISEPNVAVVLGKLLAGLRSVSGSGGCVRGRTLSQWNVLPGSALALAPVAARSVVRTLRRAGTSRLLAA
jgi:hypothetical protein